MIIQRTLTRLTAEVAKQWLYYQNSINQRFNVYGTSMNEEVLERYKKNLGLIKQGLSEEQKSTIDESRMTNEQKGCYIATAVYGSYDCSEVWTLRRYRDYSLAKNWYGRFFISSYYAISPTIVKLFGNKIWCINLFKTLLDKMVKYLSKEGYESSPYNDRDW